MQRRTARTTLHLLDSLDVTAEAGLHNSTYGKSCTLFTVRTVACRQAANAVPEHDHMLSTVHGAVGAILDPLCCKRLVLERL